MNNKVGGMNGLTDRLGGLVREDEQGGWDEWVDR